jgi:hypothetical protein
MLSKPERTSSGVRQLVSFANITPLIGSPDSVHRANSSAPVLNG